MSQKVAESFRRQNSSATRTQEAAGNKMLQNAVGGIRWQRSGSRKQNAAEFRRPPEFSRSRKRVAEGRGQMAAEGKTHQSRKLRAAEGRKRHKAECFRRQKNADGGIKQNAAEDC